MSGFYFLVFLFCQVLVWKEIDYSRLSEAAKQNLVLEVNLLRELRHDNIVRYYDRIVDKTRSVLYIIMEYCEGGDLASYIKRIKASQYVSNHQLTILFENLNLILCVYCPTCGPCFPRQIICLLFVNPKIVKNE